MYNKKKYGITGIIIAIIILIILFILTNIQNSKMSYFENVASLQYVVLSFVLSDTHGRL